MAVIAAESIFVFVLFVCVFLTTAFIFTVYALPLKKKKKKKGQVEKNELSNILPKFSYTRQKPPLCIQNYMRGPPQICKDHLGKVKFKDRNCHT